MVCHAKTQHSLASTILQWLVCGSDAGEVNLTDKNETPNDIYLDCLAVAKAPIAVQKASDLQEQQQDPVTLEDLAEEAAYEKAKTNPDWSNLIGDDET